MPFSTINYLVGQGWKKHFKSIPEGAVDIHSLPKLHYDEDLHKRRTIQAYKGSSSPSILLRKPELLNVQTKCNPVLNTDVYIFQRGECIHSTTLILPSRVRSRFVVMCREAIIGYIYFHNCRFALCRLPSSAT